MSISNKQPAYEATFTTVKDVQFYFIYLIYYIDYYIVLLAINKAKHATSITDLDAMKLIL